jgi:hypothetical protein
MRDEGVWDEMSDLPNHEEPTQGAAPPTLPIGGSDTRVMSTVSWVFLALGLFAGGLFLQDPNIARHPHLFLLGVTGLVGSAILRVLARLLRDRPVD